MFERFCQRTAAVVCLSSQTLGIRRMRIASSRAACFSLLLRERVFRSLRKTAVPGCAQVHREQRLVALRYIERERLEATEHIGSSELKVSARAGARSWVNAGQSVGAATKRVPHPTIPVASSPAVAAPLAKRATSLCGAEPHHTFVVGYSVASHSRSWSRTRLLPNLSIERTCPGKPGHASHLTR